MKIEIEFTWIKTFLKIVACSLVPFLVLLVTGLMIRLGELLARANASPEFYGGSLLLMGLVSLAITAALAIYLFDIDM
jgi:membrane-bound ClpP family serine protease